MLPEIDTASARVVLAVPEVVSAVKPRRGRSCEVALAIAVGLLLVGAAEPTANGVSPTVATPPSDPTLAPEAVPAPLPTIAPVVVDPNAAAAAELGATPEAVTRLWSERREALAEGDSSTASERLATLVELRDKAHWANLRAEGRALARETHRVLDGGDEAAALVLAEAAVALAPDVADGHFALALARWRAGQGPLASAEAAWEGFERSWLGPLQLRLRVATGLLLALAGLAAAFVAFVLASTYRHVRSLVWLVAVVLPGGARHAQAWLVVLALLAAPFAAGGPPLWGLVGWLAVVAPFFERRERIGGIVLVLLVAGLPFALPRVLGPLAHAGSRNFAVYEAALDMGAHDAARWLGDAGAVRPVEALVLAQRARSSGRLDEAAKWLAVAREGGLQGVGVDLLQAVLDNQRGDREGAIEALERAVELDPKNIVALLNLSRIYYSMTEHQKASELHRRATEVDLARVERLSDLAKRRGPTFMLEDDLHHETFVLFDWQTPVGDRLAARTWRALAGGGSVFLFLAVALSLVVWIAVMAWLRGTGGKSFRARQAGAGKAAGAALDRIRGEIQAHRHQARLARARELSAWLLAGSGQLLAGRTLVGSLYLATFVGGALSLLMAIGWIPAPLVGDDSMRGMTIGIAAAVTASCYALSLWDNRREG